MPQHFASLLIQVKKKKTGFLVGKYCTGIKLYCSSSVDFVFLYEIYSTILCFERGHRLFYDTV